MAWTYNTKVIREGRSWVDDAGVKHPTSWGSWSESEKAEAGLVFTADAPPFDSRFYWAAGVPKAIEDTPNVDEDGVAVVDADGMPTITLGLKSTEIAKVKAQAGSQLKETDWYIIRKGETNADIPSSVLIKRAEIRAASDEQEARINACTTLEELIEVLTPEPTDDGSEDDSEEVSLYYVPPSVTARQCRLVLASQGLLSSVEAAVAASSESVQIEWQFAANVNRDSLLVSSLGESLGLSPEQLDDLFKLAATL